MLPQPLEIFLRKYLIVLLWGFSLSPQAALVVERGCVRASVPGKSNSVAFMLLRNSGDEAAVLEAVLVDRATSTEMHTHRHQDGMMRMEKLEFIEVPANSSTRLRSHGDHLMLFGIERPLRDGEHVNLQLQFKGGETVEIELPVYSVGGDKSC